MKAWPALAIFIIQGILFLAHWFVYFTCIAFWPDLAPVANLRAAILILSFSFVAASLLAFRLSNAAVRLVYKVSAIWLGFLNFFFWASLLLWITWIAIRLSGLPIDSSARPLLAAVFYALATLIGIYGLANARIIRIRSVPVQIPNLPAAWTGRRAVVLSDLHLGPINGVRFCRRVVATAARLAPHAVFLPGDLFDGTHADLDRLLAPFRSLTPPCGIYFSTGNHEEFTVATHYIDAINRAGIRALANEVVTIDGLQIAGVLYQDSTHIIRMKAFLESLHLNHAQPCILLNHAPIRLPIVEQAGVALQVSGHTHGGQMLPFSWLTRSVFGRFTSGLHRFGALQVFTSTGAGTWGPPMRVGSRPEVVLLKFE